MHKYFEWDDNKNRINLEKHGIDFEKARWAFFDKKRIFTQDAKHSKSEERIYCIGRISEGVVTIRFTYRGGKIRIFGAGFWKKGKKIYEKENSLYR